MPNSHPARAALILAAALLAACQPSEPEEVSGRALYEDYCQTCHGPAGRGDGPSAAGLSRRPADLTRISARNGGTFPLVGVMSTIDGYTRVGRGGTVMPELGAIFADGPVEMVDTGGGVLTPTPAKLVALADYLRGLQVR
jgi:mono/diheme cytochrome c family protein